MGRGYLKRTGFLGLMFIFVVFISALPQAWAQTSPPAKLSGKLLKEKMATIEVLQDTPTRAYTRLGPLWASKTSMDSTMNNIRKQAAKLGADAIIELKVRTEKLQSATYDPGWPGAGVGPYGGWWGGMNYWGGYVQAHTYTQPVVTGWAVKWE